MDILHVERISIENREDKKNQQRRRAAASRNESRPRGRRNDAWA
jgi:hypothetical protein